MTKKVSQPSAEHYIVPARQLSGTREEVLAQIDELILGLTGLRQLVSLHGPTPADVPRRKLHLVKGFLKLVFVIGIALWASPAQGQTPSSSSTPSLTLRRVGALADAWTCSSPWPRTPCRAILPTSRGQRHTANDFKSNHVAAVLKPTGRVTWIVTITLVERTTPSGRFGGADLRKVQNTALVGGVWWFGTKDGVW
jgi:hypothetical protein